jgi:predicted AAA+ superfamily ATPase
MALTASSVLTLLFESLRAENASHELDYELFYWRLSDGTEVDFILYGQHGLHAFEITRSSIFREADLAGLRLFCSDYPDAKGHLFYGGSRRYRFGSIDVVPMAEGLSTLGTTRSAPPSSTDHSTWQVESGRSDAGRR